ncbi:MAG: hypothetical protein HYW07_17780 [Candidatus Latescibacteria bacterium]|nr:hypothetical protein [Candidatus Latescibacterota bacterium]
MKQGKVHFILGLATLGLLCALVVVWVGAASARLDEASGQGSQVALASAADEGYCSGPLKVILRRVLTSCGLMSASGGRGCQPLEAKNVAAMSSGDFNALFLPLKDRVAIIQFEQDSDQLDPAATQLLERTFADQRGASYFLVVARASPEGSVEHNRDLSQRRGGAVLDHLGARFNDPDLDKEVGLLWLGEEFAQLEEDFCSWTRSHPEAPCSARELNRSAFIAWIDCQL